MYVQHAVEGSVYYTRRAKQPDTPASATRIRQYIILDGLAFYFWMLEKLVTKRHRWILILGTAPEPELPLLSTFKRLLKYV